MMKETELKTHKCLKCGEQVVLECFEYDDCDIYNRRMMNKTKMTTERSKESQINRLSYKQAKAAIDLFDSEWIGQDPKQLWDWAVSEVVKEAETG